MRERRAADPIVPFHLLRTGPVAIASAALFLATAALFSVTVFVPLFLETTTGASPTEAGLLLVPAMLGIAVSTTLSGRAIVRTGRYKRFPIAGLALMTAALVLLAAFAGDPSQVATGIALAVFGLGFGMVTQVLVVAVQNSVERRELGVATATTGFFRALGGAVGAAVLGAVFAAQAGAHGGAQRAACAPTSSTASRPSSWSPPRSPRWRCSSSCACPSCPCRPPTASRRGGQMASGFSTAVALRGEQTDGAISVVENTVPARWDGPPLHHHEFDETFYVLDGELTFQLGDELFTAGPGALAFAPGGVAHTLANLTDAPARYLLLCTPAGFEGYFARLAAQAAGEDPPRVGAGAHAAGDHGRWADRRARRRRRGGADRARDGPGQRRSRAASRPVGGSR